MEKGKRGGRECGRPKRKHKLFPSGGSYRGKVRTIWGNARYVCVSVQFQKRNVYMSRREERKSRGVLADTVPYEYYQPATFSMVSESFVYNHASKR